MKKTIDIKENSQLEIDSELLDMIFMYMREEEKENEFFGRML